MEDNARKFIVKPIDSVFLKQNSAVSFNLIVDWMITEEESERKLVCKAFDTGEVQYWLVEKVINNGRRTTKKTKLTVTEYEQTKTSTKIVTHLEKRRHEFNFMEDGISFALEYDEFKGGNLYMLEVDGKNEEERESFTSETFSFPLEEVTGKIKYYGYRVANIV